MRRERGNRLWRSAAFVVALFAIPASLAAQQAERPKFDVASIKPASPGIYTTFHALEGGRLSAEGTLEYFMMNAYEIRQFQIIGPPGWVRSDRYHIEAKAEGEAPRATVMQMAQALLEDRFRLQYHRETRALPVFELLLAKSSPKLPAAVEGDCEDSPNASADRSPSQTRRPPCGRATIALAPGEAHLTGSRIPMREFTRVLALIMGRQVIDKTGMSASYGIDLRFVPDSIAAGLPPLPPANSPAPADSGPSILIALQEQLGLKLDSVKGPVEVMVIDHVERPSEN